MQNLTNKEIEILNLLTNGYSNKEIANEMKISTHTVKAHINCILKKSDAKNVLDAALKFLKRH